MQHGSIRWVWLALSMMPSMAGSEEPASLPLPRTPGGIVISRDVTFVTGPRTESGSLDLLAALRRHVRQGVTAENNAAPLLKRAVGRGEVSEKLLKAYCDELGIELPDDGDYLIPFGDRFSWEHDEALYDRLRDAPWRSDDFPEAADWIADNERPLQLVAEACLRSRCVFPLLPDRDHQGPKLIAILLPDVQTSRSIVRILRVRANMHLGNGDFDAAIADLKTSHRLGRLIAQGPTLVELLVGIAIDGIANAGDLALANTKDVPPNILQDYATWVSGLPEFPPAAERINFAERLMMVDIAVAFSEGRVCDLSPLTADAGGLPVPELLIKQVNWNVVLDLTNRRYDELVAAMSREGYAAQRSAVREILRQVKRDAGRANWGEWGLGLLTGDVSAAAGKQMSHALSALLMPAVEAVLQAQHRAEMQSDLVAVALLLRTHRELHGAYPDLLSDAEGMSPDLMNDRFGGELRYELRGDGYLLYSVGANQSDDDANSHISQTVLGEHAGDEAASSAEGDDLVVRMPLPGP